MKTGLDIWIEGEKKKNKGKLPLKYPNGAPMYDDNGMFLDDKGNRSIFDDVAD